MRTILQVKGMHCTSCEILIKDVLNDEGAQVKANYTTGVVIVEHDTSLSKEKIKQLISEEGYEVL